MAKMYYNLEEAMARLGCTEDQLRGMVRSGRLREFRDAGKLNYRVDEVDRIASPSASGSGAHVLGHDSGELAVDEVAEIALTPVDPGIPANLSGSGSGPAMAGSGSAPGLSGSDIPIDLSGSDTGMGLGRTGSGEVRLDDSKTASATGEIRLDDTGTPPTPMPSPAAKDAMSLDEVDKEAVSGMKKDDTVITNIGISVFDDDDLEIAADPMAKTLLSGGDEHLGLDGSGGGSGLLDLTRESDDTSLGAELLEGIDMGDTAETVAQSAATEAAPAAAAEETGLPEPAMEAPVAMVPVVVGGVTEAASPAFTGLLAAAAIVLFLAGAANIAMAVSDVALPGYLQMLAEQFWFFLGGAILVGGIFALVGWLMGRAPSAPRAPKEKKPKEKKGKAKKGEAGPATA